ncbi:MAG: glycoside hydrolase family 25 protein [Acetatifactor sp.]|nr:glycoside hydrolase family 25 protein [Acetatifactor sp.]
MDKVFGIDVSKYQGEIDFSKVKADGVNFVIIRAGYGKALKQKDPLFEKNYTNAKACGLNVGVYWFSYAQSEENAKAEAEVCLDVLKGKQFEYPVFFDLEEEQQLSKGKPFCGSLVNAFCNTVEEAGYFAGLYMSRSPLQTCIETEIASKYTLWVAEYNNKCNYDGHIGMWQYTNKGKVNGISGNVDLDYAYVDYPEIIKAKKLNGF